MKCLIDTHDKSKGCCSERELTEEQFFEQFAALEDGLTLLQNQMRGMSENAKLFGRTVRQMRRSICPTTHGEHSTLIGLDSRYPETTAEVVRSKAGDHQTMMSDLSG